MSLKAKVEAIIYAAEEPITLEQMASLLKDTILADLASAKENAAIEQADSIAEELASAPTSGRVESTDIPELTSDSPDSNGDAICPEEGPLMPESATPDNDNSEEIPAPQATVEAPPSPSITTSCAPSPRA